MKKRKKNARGARLPRGIMAVLTGWALLAALLIRIPIGSDLAVSGQGYFSVALEWFLVFALVGCGGMFHAVSRMVSLRIEKGSARNAKRVVSLALVTAFLSGVLLTALLFLGAQLFAGKISGVSRAVPALQCFAASVLPLCLLAVLMGGLDGFGFTNTAFMPGFVACIAFLIAGKWSTGAFRSYGDSVGALLQNGEFGPAYAAFGAAAGLAMASWLGVITALLGWLYKKRAIHMLTAGESGYAVEHEKHMMRGIFNARMAVLLTIWIPVLAFWLQDLLFQSLVVKKEAGTISDWGVYAGMTGSLLTVFLFVVLALAIRQLPGLRICFERRNLKKSRGKLLVMLRAMAVLTIPWAVFMGILAQPLCGLFFEQVPESAAALLRTGGFSVIFFGMAAALGGVLWSMKKEVWVPAGLMLSGALMLVVLALLMKFTDLGIRAVVWADLVWALALFLIYFGAVLRLERVRINWLPIFLPPCIGTAIAGLVCYFLAHFLGQSASEGMVCAVSLLVSCLLYFVAEIVLHGINQKVLREFPGGDKLYALAHMLRLM